MGARYLADDCYELLSEFDRAIAVDRRDVISVITHQARGRCCSDAFAEALCDQLNERDMLMMPDDTGVYHIDLEKSPFKSIGKKIPNLPKENVAKAEGYLTIGSTPWSNVYLNDKNIGVAPLLKKPTEAGKYVIRLENPGEKLTLKYSIVVKPYAEMKCIFDLRKKVGNCKAI